MEKLLQQIRDNQRFENWTFFPGNKIEIIYHRDDYELHLYKRKDREGTWVCEIIIEKKFDDKGRLVSEEYIEKSKSED